MFEKTEQLEEMQAAKLVALEHDPAVLSDIVAMIVAEEKACDA